MNTPSVKGRARAVRDVKRSVAAAVSARVEDRICYSFDATDLRFMPDAVAWPNTASQVREVVRAALVNRLPVVPRGAGTGYTGGSVPVEGGIALSLETMNRVLAVDGRNRAAVVEPGVVNEDLRSTVASLGLTYPPDPASLKVSTLGGNIAESAGGPRTVLHGTTRDYVVGLELVLADGTRIRTGALTAPRSGWDAAPLFVGSEGTLAVVTAAALRLTQRPDGYATLWSEFPSLEQAAHAVAAITAAGLPVSVLEILDGETYACAHDYVRGRPPVGRPDGALLIELEGPSTAVAEAAESTVSLLRAEGAVGVREAADGDERDEIWEIRRSISPALARLGAVKINEDIAVPRSEIPSFVRTMRRVSRDVDLPILAFGHAGDGNLHVNIMLESGSRSEFERAREAVTRLFEAAVALGGVLSGEHGIGMTKAEHMRSELSDVALDVTARVKRALDPTGMLNPGKILTDRPNPWWSMSEDGSGGRRC